MGFLCKVCLSILPQARSRQDSASCPSTSCYSGPFNMPSAGESERAEGRRRGGRKGGTTSGTPFPSDSSLITVQTVSRRLNNNRGASLVASGLCTHCAYRKDHYMRWTACSHRSLQLTLQLVCRDLFLLFKHSGCYIRMNHNSPSPKFLYIETYILAEL